MKKKSFIFLILCVALVSTSNAQKNSFGLSVGFGKGMIVKKPLEGGPAYDLNLGYSLGLQFNRSLSERIDFSSGVTWYSNTVSVTPIFYPGGDMTSADYDLQLIYIPVFLKISLSKYFFLNGGLIGDLDVSRNSSISSQSGVGAGLGFGGKVDISKSFTLELNPYLNFHGLLFSRGERHPERILDSGIKLNILLR